MDWAWAHNLKSRTSRTALEQQSKAPPLSVTDGAIAPSAPGALDLFFGRLTHKGSCVPGLVHEHMKAFRFVRVIHSKAPLNGTQFCLFPGTIFRQELDIFKLDIIARELKALDTELGMVGKEAGDGSTIDGCALGLASFVEAKFLQQSAGRLKDFGEQQQIHQSWPQTVQGQRTRDPVCCEQESVSKLYLLSLQRRHGSKMQGA